MVTTIAALLLFQLLGQVTVSLSAIAVPGTVMGLVYFLLALLLFPSLIEKTRPVVNVLLAHFALLFVPAGVGIMEHSDVLFQQWLPISVAILGSSVLSMLVTLWVTRALMRLMHTREN